jgi:hypothetical protein
MKRWIIFVHRYVGIPMSLVFVVWFLSGIVMMYTGDMPALEADDRLRGRGAIDFGAIAQSPAEAAELADMGGAVTVANLQTLLGRPAYRLRGGFGPQATIFADTGQSFSGATIDQGRAEVARFLDLPLEAVEHAETVRRVDQWTIAQARNLPLERFDVDDGRGTRAYFSLRTGEVELITRRASRALAWIGAIPHWFYFTPLRTNQPLWYWSVVWVAAIGSVLAVLGIILAFTQFRRSRPFRLSASIRYRGWMRWHYYTGAVFGVFALTWVFSGLLSMEPFAWTNARGMALPPNNLQGGTLELERYRLEPGLQTALSARPAYELELIRIQSEPYFVVTGDRPVDRRVIDAETLEVRTEPFAPAAIIAELETTAETAAILEFDVLDRYDAYYYARAGAAPLPALRVKFDDPAATWYYFDLNTNEAVYATHRLSRLERWLFNGLHSLDFSFWYDRRPLWDIGMILLSLGALATSGIGLYLGTRRLLGRPATRPGR